MSILMLFKKVSWDLLTQVDGKSFLVSVLCFHKVLTQQTMIHWKMTKMKIERNIDLNPDNFLSDNYINKY